MILSIGLPSLIGVGSYKSPTIDLWHIHTLTHLFCHTPNMGSRTLILIVARFVTRLVATLSQVVFYGNSELGFYTGSLERIDWAFSISVLGVTLLLSYWSVSAIGFGLLVSMPQAAMNQHP